MNGESLMTKKSKLISLILIFALLLTAFPSGSVINAEDVLTAYPKVNFSDSSIATASGLTLSTSYKFDSSSASAKFYVKATGKETKVFSFSSYGIATDWNNGDTIVIPMYNRYAGSDVVNIIMSRGTTSADKTTAGYFSTKLTLDWTGWKLVKIPKSKFGKSKTALTWSEINSVFFNMGGWGTQAPTGVVEFYIDSVYLASNASTDECFVDGTDSLVAKEMGLTSEKITSTDAYPYAKFTTSGTEKATKGFKFENYCISTDWSAVKKIDFRIYNVNANGQRVNVAVNKTADNNVRSGYYYSTFNLDWTGWKTVSVPVGSMSKNYGISNMSQISTIFLNVGGWPAGSAVASDVEFYIGHIEGITSAELIKESIPDSCAVYANSTKALKELSVETLDNPTVYIDNVVYAPLSIFEKLFGAVSDASTLEYASMKLEFTEGRAAVKIGSYEHRLCANAICLNGEIYAPLSDLCEIFDIPLHSDGRLSIMGSDSDIDFIKAYYDRGVNEISEEIAEKLSPVSSTNLTEADCEAVIENWLKGTVGNEETNDLSNTTISNKINSFVSNANSYRAKLIKTEGSKELFDDITTTTTANMTTTANRIKGMALAYGAFGSTLYQNEELLEDILYSLEWFYENRYGLDEINGTGWRSTSGYNWHDWKIGTPGAIIDTLMIVRSSLTDVQISNYLKCFHHVSPNTYSSGANYMDACELIIGAAALEKNPQRVLEFKNNAEKAFVYVQNSRQLESQLDSARQAYTPNKGHGFYTDGSYVYHTLHAMNGTYGLSHLTSASELVTLFDGTKFEIAKPYVDNMADWIVNTFDSGIYGTRMMRMFLGRGENPSETSISRTVVNVAVKCFELFDEEDKMRIGSVIKEYASYSPSGFASAIDIDYVDKYYEIANSDIYNQYRYDHANVFSNVDKVLQRREDWGIGISMSSSRIFNYECINNLNKNGWYLGDGRTELILRDDANVSAYAYWNGINYYRLPGTTVDTQERKLATIAQGNEYLSSKDFVGGVELEDKYSTAAMHLESYHNETDFGKNGGDYGGPAPAHTSDLTAKKSYFMFDNEIYCLGTEIMASNNNNAEVLTVFENKPGKRYGSSRLIISEAGANRESENFDIKKYGAGNDWSKVTTIRAPVYSKAANGEWVNVIICKDAKDANLGYFFKKFQVDWTGWKIVELSTSSFSKARGIKNWEDINSMYFNIGGWANPAPQVTTDICFSDLECLDSSGNVIHTIPFTSSLVAADGQFDFTSAVVYGNVEAVGKADTNLGELSIPNGIDKVLSDVSWINVDGEIGYVFPDSSMNGTLRGTYTSNGYFEGTISHDVNPSDGSYAYAILPNKNAEQTAAYAENPDVEILANNSNVQAVRYNKENITSIVFWNAGTFDYITVTKPMILMIKEDGNEMTLAVSDPTHKLTTANITLAKPLLLSYADSRITQTGMGSSLKLAVDFDETLGTSLQAKIKGGEAILNSVEFKDSSGNIISQYVSQNETKVGVTLYVTNLTSSAYNGRAYAATYSASGVLESIQTALITNLAVGRKRTAAFTVTPTAETKRIEVYVWDNGGIKPCGTLYRN